MMLARINFGAPAAGMTLRAQGVGPGVRFGTPTTTSRTACVADPIGPGAQFGTPVVTRRYHTNSIAPAARFGKPLLTRSATC